jgi:hypothetical protein
VVLGVLVHLPEIVGTPPRLDVLDRQHRGHHRVVLVVVLVHAVAADDLQRRKALLQLPPQRRDARVVALVVDGIGLGLTGDTAVQHVVLARQADPAPCPATTI